jgi:hypothetical protein
VFVQEPCVEVVSEDEDHVRTIRGLEDARGRTTAEGEQAGAGVESLAVPCLFRDPIRHFSSGSVVAEQPP